MVIAAGSYPAGRWFESDRRYQKRPHGQAVKTSPFHGGNPSSSLGGVTKQREAALSERFFHRRITPHGGLAQLVRALALQARGHRFKSGSLHHLAARRISQHPAGKSCRVFALTPAARFPLASRTPPYRVLCILSFFVLPTLAGALRAFRARRISQHPAGKPCRVFALTPAARFPLASRTLPHKVSSLRLAPLRYFAGAPFERLQSVGVRIFFVLPTLAGALRRRGESHRLRCADCARK